MPQITFAPTLHGKRYNPSARIGFSLEMAVPLQAGGTLQEQMGKLAACEELLLRNHQLALAGTLIGATMHEINNRLAALTNYIYLAQIALSTPDDAVQYLDSASDELRSVGEITSRSLSFVRVDRVAKDIDLIELAKSALELHHDKISDKRINVELRMADGTTATGKRGELLQVLVNLLLNSIEALPDAGNLHLRVALHGADAVMTIADNGTGIPADFRPSLFQSFKSSKEEGNGLGLWTVKQIIDKHKGRISYRTSIGPRRSGTVFRIVLPAKAA